MGGSSKQVTGYRYFANFLLFIGNPIEKVLGINFDKRGWQTPLIDEQKNPLSIGEVKLPNLYGENEGGVAGKIHARYGTENPDPVDFYSSYLAENDLPPLAYPYQSYLAFKDFYLGNSGYMKEMLLWPKRIHVRNDGRSQWYDEKAEINTSNNEANNNFDPNWRYKEDVNYEIYSSIEDETRHSISSVFHDNNHIIIFNHSTISGTREYGKVSAVYDFTGQVGWLTINLTLSYWGADFKSIKWSGGRFRVISQSEIDYEKYLTIQIEATNSKGIFSLEVERYSPANSGVSLRLVIHPYYFEPIAFSDLKSGDINPIHKIREILTDDTAMNKPESDVNDVNFMKAADRIWDEGFGISWSITEKSCLEAINELCGHIEAGVRVNRQTGLYEMVLFRDDWFEESEIHTLSVNKIKSMSLEVANADEAINQLNVSYYNRDAIKDSSFSIVENASIRNLNGRVNAEDAAFPYFMNQRNAAVVAQWKLKQISSPVWKGSFTAAEYNARKWNRYDLLKLAWPRKWQGTITVRIMKINLGTGTDVSIDFVEVVPHSSNLSSDIVIDEPIDIAPQPPLACQYEPFEMPYYLAVMALGQRQVDEELSYENNFGLAAVVAEKPQSNSLYAVMMTHNGVEGEEWVRAATINYEPVADLDQMISRTSTTFTVKDSAAIAGLPIGTLIKCGSDWIGTPGEWMVFQGVDAYTGVVSVKRGALDSLPQAWGVNTKLYFCGNDVAFDSVEYIAGEEVLISALTTTPSGMLENKGAIAIEMNARAVRPYPPANVKINGEYWPEEIETDLVLTWVDRNRTQQTGGEILGYFDGGVTLENGVNYQLIITEFDADQIELRTQSINVGQLNSYTFAVSAMQANTFAIEITLKSIRDNYECLQAFTHIVELSRFYSAPYDLTVEFKDD
ncbi:hypothetical protein [Acinetobacter sp. ANC 5600]|uniref:hypothetical protein n=1 Tax=Acinetobacter sp. ANC 5600 TaxID=1960940 RepID=UPI000991DFDC|nr:hypothetical protein [Acinetobacter sp. ANC 5600]OOV83807.1 hypothetical protein B1201_00715 [Acinetobacter sp. ANC 5600]